MGDGPAAGGPCTRPARTPTGAPTPPPAGRGALAGSSVTRDAAHPEGEGGWPRDGGDGRTGRTAQTRRGGRRPAVAAVGPVRQRPAVGHGARGPQPGRRGLVVPDARPGAVPCLPVGRGRHRRGVRRPSAPLPGTEPVERP